MPQLDRELSKSEQVIKYLLPACRGQIAKTRLVKLLYMVDHEAYRYLGRPISELQWKRESYGPYDDRGFHSTTESLERAGLLRQTQSFTWFGNPTFIYHDSGGPVGFDFTPAEKKILSYVASEYARLNREELVHDVVYQTKPFKAVEDRPRGTPIPFDEVVNERRDALGGIDVEAAVRGALDIKEGRGVPLREVVGELLG